ncbi:mucin-4 [Camelus dromedarius]|uniref:mucin-4 n=1 Tax=Camelus dromedarius TaxID=9838 RepID=UPI003119F318
MLTAPTSTGRTPSPSSVSNTSPMTSKTVTSQSSLDTPTGRTGDTSTPVAGSNPPVTSAVSTTRGPVEQSTSPPSTSSRETTSTSPQASQTQSLETTADTQASTITAVSTSTPSSSTAGPTSTLGLSPGTNPAGETTTSSPSSVSHTPGTTSQMLTAPTSTGRTPSPSSVSNTSPMTSKTVTSQSSLDTPTGRTGDTSTPTTSTSPQASQTQSLETTADTQASTITAVSTSTPSSSTAGPTSTLGLSPGTNPAGETTTSSPSSVSHTPGTTSQMLTAPTSTGRTPSPSSVSNTSPMTSKTVTSQSSLDTPTGRTGDTSMPVAGSNPPVTSAVSTTRGLVEQSTSPTSTTSRETTSTSPQASQTQSLETTAETEASTIAVVNTSTVSSSTAGPTSTVGFSPGTNPAGETTTSSPSSVSHTPGTTSQMLTAPTSTGRTPSPSSVSNTSPMTSKTVTSQSSLDTLTGRTGDTSTPVAGSNPPVTSAVSTTRGLVEQSTSPTSTTSRETTSTSPQASQTQSLETTAETEASTIAVVNTSTVSSSTAGPTSTVGFSPGTNPAGETTTSSPSSVSHTPGTTSQMLTAPTSTGRTPSPSSVSNTSPMTSKTVTSQSSLDTLTGRTGDTSTPVAGSNPPVTSAVSTTRGLVEQSTSPPSTSSRETTSTSPQASQTQSLETTADTQASTITAVSTSTPSSSTAGPTSTLGLSPGTNPAGETTTSSPSSVSHTPGTTSQMLTAPTSTGRTPSPSSVSNTSPMTSKTVTSQSSLDTPTGRTGDTSMPVAGSNPPVTSAVSTTRGLVEQSTSPTSTTSRETTSTSPQASQTQSLETTAETQARTITAVNTSTPSSSTAGPTSTLGISPGTNPAGETTTSSPSSVSHTPGTTSQMLTAPTSTGRTSSPSSISNTSPMTSKTVTSQSSLGTPTGRTGDTSTPVAGSNPPVTSAVSTTRGLVEQSTSPPSTSSHSSQDHHSREHINPLIIYSRTHIYTGHFSRDKPRRRDNHVIPIQLAQLVQFSLEECLGEDGTTITSLRTGSKRSTTSLPSTTSQSLTASTSRTSTGTHSTAAPGPIKPEKGVSLFPYGPTAGDLEFVRRTVDFTSPLFKPQIGFPIGSSLRDSLYFTDNGQIIFPEYQIFSDPNPPLGGFTARDPVAMVAPFWDDADFSSHRGTVFYQEYETLYDEYNPLVQGVESQIKMLTDAWIYKAKWTLKVTWVRAPAYPAWRTFGTNTYQAILSTDGSRSYALFLYQSGGMQWDVTQRPGNPVLMGFTSGDGYFENSPLTFQPLWERYRPDQFLDSNSGLRGLQVYKLHRKEKPNHRLRCLQSLKRQPQGPSLPCPCSWQQGLWDLRFQPINIGWWYAGSSQLCSFSSWRGGVCCSYGLWGELLEGWRVQSPWQFDQELEAQNWCCRFNDKPSFCALYQLRRPRIGCSGYQPPRPAWMFGDPHITTLDGANYTFNGLGDFLLVQAQDRNSSFMLQGRTAQTGSAQATNFIAFAAKYSSSTLDPITVQWFLEPNDTIHVRLNNQNVTTTREGAEGQVIVNTTGVIMTRNGSMVSANFDGAVTVSVIALSNILHASCSLPEEYQNHTEGLMGFWNGNPHDDFRMPNGSTIALGSTEETLFHYGMTWEINGTSLLGKRNDHLPSNFTPVFLSQLRENKSLNGNLTSQCNGDEQCIYDTLATQNVELGQHTGMLFRVYQQMNSTLNQYPPPIEGLQELKAFTGQTTQVRYASSAENVTFTLRNNGADFKLFENGTLLWTPKLLEPFTLEILARSAKDGLSSVLKPRTVVCACKAKSQCLYNQTNWVGNSSLEVANCMCDENTFGQFCERSSDPCDVPCFQGVKCIPGKGCEACPPHLTGDGRHCTSLENSFPCQNKSCPANYCYNYGHCYISQTADCQPACICPPAFTDTRCFLAGNNFTPAARELPIRIIQLLLTEDENASSADVNASVAYRLRNLEVRTFLRNREVNQIDSPASGSSVHHWKIISEFQYLPGGPVIDFLNTQLLDAVVEAFLPQAQWRRRKRSEGPRSNVIFYPISREDVHSVMALNVSTLETYLQCNSYKGYRLVFSPQSGFTCVSPCSEGYCEHGGQCQHLPDGPRCSCVPSSIYTAWGMRCEHLSVKYDAFLGILFGSLGALLLLGLAVFVVLRFCGCSGTRYSSYPLNCEN